MFWEEHLKDICNQYDLQIWRNGNCARPCASLPCPRLHPMAPMRRGPKPSSARETIHRPAPAAWVENNEGLQVNFPAPEFPQQRSTGTNPATCASSTTRRSSIMCTRNFPRRRSSQASSRSCAWTKCSRYLHSRGQPLTRLLTRFPARLCRSCNEQIISQCNLMEDESFGSDVYLKAFNYSMMTQIDEINSDRIFQMSLVEYYEALARIAETANLPPFSGLFPVWIHFSSAPPLYTPCLSFGTRPRRPLSSLNAGGEAEGGCSCPLLFSPSI